MYSTRIRTICTFINKEDSVVDIGCDHGYLSLYLKINNLCKNVIASDINEIPLKQAKKNFKNYKVKIKSYLSDGFDNIDDYFDTAVIAGMGTTTILKIIRSNKTPNKLIIASNNDYYLLRKELNKKEYYLEEEQVVYEKGHYYPIMKYVKGKQKLSKKELLFGKSNNKNYYMYLLNKNHNIMFKVPFTKKIQL